MINARPDNSHLYADAYAGAKAMAKALTRKRQPVIPRTVVASAMLEVVAELMDGPIGHIAREAVAEDVALLLGKVAQPLRREVRDKLDQMVMAGIGGS